MALHWYQGTGACIKGLEKNMFAACEYNWGKVLMGLSLFVFFNLFSYAGLFLFPDPAGYGFLGALILMHGLFGYYGSQYRVRWYHHVFLPVAVFLQMYAIAHSSWKTWRQGGIYWRDTFYPLDTLKRERYRSPTG